MLSRRHLRIKVIQALYAFFQSRSDDLPKGEKHLLRSTEKLYDLYIYHLSFLTSFMDHVNRRVGDARNKFFPSEEDLDPNMRLIDNALIKQLDSNRDFERKVDKLKINWAEDDNLFHRIYNDFKENPSYQSYMADDRCRYKDDKEIISTLIKDHLFENELLQHFYEDRDIFWADGDYELALQMVLKTIYMYKEDWDEDQALPNLYKTEGTSNEDKKFMRDLFNKTVIHSKDYETLIDDAASNWELERIAVMDVIILKAALAEIMGFPSIPVKVTMNEYIELAKHYSSAKSKIFVNGILDKLIQQLNDEGKIKKTGRGLIDKSAGE